MRWKLVQVGNTEWIQDDSGYYTLIHHVLADCDGCNKVRIDIMDKDDMPVISFQGTADNVRKYIMQQWCGKISIEHASYIGVELARCELQGINYVQN